MSREDRQAARALRREMRNEAFDFCREHPNFTSEELKAHLNDEFGDATEIAGFDPTMWLMLIMEIIKFIQALWKRET